MERAYKEMSYEEMYDLIEEVYEWILSGVKEYVDSNEALEMSEDNVNGFMITNSDTDESIEFSASLDSEELMILDEDEEGDDRLCVRAVCRNATYTINEEISEDWEDVFEEPVIPDRKDAERMTNQIINHIKMNLE